MQYPKCKVIANLSTFESHEFTKQINVHSPVGFKVYSYIHPNDYFYITICLKKKQKPIMIAEFNFMKGSFSLNLKEKVKTECGWSYPSLVEKSIQIFCVNYYSASRGLANRSGGYLVKPESAYYLIVTSNKVFTV